MKKVDDYQSIRIWKKTQKLLRLLAALTNESMVGVIHRLAEEELERVQKQEGKQTK